MREITDFHHFREDELKDGDRVARCERWVVQTLIESPLGDEGRESSIAFELKHHHSVAQFARVLARKREMPLDPCTVGALLHDVYVIVEGRYADHAHQGTPIALGVMDEIGGFSGEEKDMVERIVYFHSDKHEWTDDPFVEFGKDADVLDCFLYPGAFGFYLRHKPLGVFAHYLRRADLVWSELGLPKDPRFAILDGYEEGWLGANARMLPRDRSAAAVAGLLSGPPFFLRADGDGVFLARAERAGDLGEAGPGSALDLERTAGELIERSARDGAGLLVVPALGGFQILEPGSPRLAELGVA